MRSLNSYENTQSSSSDLPFGMFKDESSPGNNDGTEIVAAHMQDLYYSLYQILQLAGFTPNGNLENGNTQKQFLSALSNIAPLLYNSTTTYNKNAITLQLINNEINVYKSLVTGNQNPLSMTSAWVLLAKITSAGVFENVKLDSPTITGIPTAPTAADGTSNTQIATTEFVKKAFSNFLKITTGRNTNGAAIYPPEGYTMSNLVAFIPAISEIHYSGDVNNDDSTYCRYRIGTSYITLEVRSSEQRASTYANWLAIWVKI